MSSRRTLEQALPITPWQQALRGLRALQTTSLVWAVGWRGGGEQKQARVRACGDGGKEGRGGRFPRFPPPGLCKLTWPTGVGWG